MKFVATTAAGQLATLEARVPTPGAREVVVKVTAATVNPVDLMVRDGVFHDLGVVSRYPVGLGWDFVGKITAIGESVTGLRRPDQTVAGVITEVGPDHGGLAEYVMLPEADIAAVPAGLTPLQAAG